METVSIRIGIVVFTLSGYGSGLDLSGIDMLVIPADFWYPFSTHGPRGSFCLMILCPADTIMTQQLVYVCFRRNRRWFRETGNIAPFTHSEVKCPTWVRIHCEINFSICHVQGLHLERGIYTIPGSAIFRAKIFQHVATAAYYQPYLMKAMIPLYKVMPPTYLCCFKKT